MIDVSDLMARVDKALEQFEQDMQSSECHGWLVGLICARGDFDWKEWSAMVAPQVDSDDLLAQESLAVLEGLRPYSRHWPSMTGVFRRPSTTNRQTMNAIWITCPM